MNWKIIHLYLYTLCRYFLATVIISYAFAKIFETQFISQPSTYDKPIGTLNGFQLTWYYYGYSYWYGLVIAITQIISSILLFFRKTSRIGIILFLTFIVNILLMDFAYDIQGAKGMALTLTIIALFVFLSDYKALKEYFIDKPPLFRDSDRPAWMNKTSKIKFVYIPLVFIGFFVLIDTLKNKYMGKNDFYGTWENTETEERLHFEAANTFQIKKKNELNDFVSGEYSYKKDLLQLDSTSSASTKDKQIKHIYLRGKYKLGKNTLRIILKHDTLVFRKIR